MTIGEAREKGLREKIMYIVLEEDKRGRDGAGLAPFKSGERIQPHEVTFELEQIFDYKPPALELLLALTSLVPEFLTVEIAPYETVRNTMHQTEVTTFFEFRKT